MTSRIVGILVLILVLISGGALAAEGGLEPHPGSKDLLDFVLSSDGTLSWSRSSDSGAPPSVGLEVNTGEERLVGSWSTSFQGPVALDGIMVSSVFLSFDLDSLGLVGSAMVRWELLAGGTVIGEAVSQWKPLSQGTISYTSHGYIKDVVEPGQEVTLNMFVRHTGGTGEVIFSHDGNRCGTKLSIQNVGLNVSGSDDGMDGMDVEYVMTSSDGWDLITNASILVYENGSYDNPWRALGDEPLWEVILDVDGIGVDTPVDGVFSDSLVVPELGNGTYIVFLKVSDAFGLDHYSHDTVEVEGRERLEAQKNPLLVLGVLLIGALVIWTLKPLVGRAEKVTSEWSTNRHFMMLALVVGLNTMGMLWINSMMGFWIEDIGALFFVPLKAVLFTIVLGVTGYFWGRFSDRTRIRKKLVVYLLFANAFLHLLIPFITIWPLLVIITITATYASLFGLTNVMVTEYFPDRKGSMLGYMFFVTSVGSIAGSFPTGFIYEAYGYPTLIFMGCVAVFSSAVLMLFVRESSHRESLGVGMDRDGIARVLSGLKDGLGGVGRARFSLASLRERFTFVNSTLIYAITGILFCFGAGAAVITYVFGNYLRHIGVEIWYLGVAGAIGGTLGAVFNLVLGRMCDRVGAERMFALALGIHGAVWVAFSLVSDPDIVMYFIIFPEYVFFPVAFTALVSELTREEERATAFGFIGIFSSIGAILGLVIATLFAWYTIPYIMFWRISVVSIIAGLAICFKWIYRPGGFGMLRGSKVIMGDDGVETFDDGSELPEV